MFTGTPSEKARRRDARAKRHDEREHGSDGGNDRRRVEDPRETIARDICSGPK